MEVARDPLKFLVKGNVPTRKMQGMKRP